MKPKKTDEIEQLKKMLCKSDSLFELCQIASKAKNVDSFCTQLYEIITKDSLTKLYTRSHFYLLLEHELKRSIRYKHEFALLILDIDDFKEINDTFGHPFGDRCLKEIASIIKHSLRKIDACARYGGEEFIALLPETSLKSAKNISERLRKHIENSKIKSDTGEIISVTASIGLAEYPTHSDKAEKLIEMADKALYMAKKNGKNNVAIYKIKQ